MSGRAPGLVKGGTSPKGGAEGGGGAVAVKRHIKTRRRIFLVDQFVEGFEVEGADMGADGRSGSLRRGRDAIMRPRGEEREEGSTAEHSGVAALKWTPSRDDGGKERGEGAAGNAPEHEGTRKRKARVRAGKRWGTEKKRDTREEPQRKNRCPDSSRRRPQPGRSKTQSRPCPVLEWRERIAESRAAKRLVGLLATEWTKCVSNRRVVDQISHKKGVARVPSRATGSGQSHDHMKWFEVELSSR
ncbi:hypothetical protein DFH07DRAFT_782144 [Mycena maculata]|uniref:Uncharacterized protein n=1 Tax=Mycena maculata TaxID=230809 RepID=A0AAD7MQU0_9AGAR|nr:hypothetical protein DFH07DRAFT_782144 [Mycena maculata]